MAQSRHATSRAAKWSARRVPAPCDTPHDAAARCRLLRPGAAASYSTMVGLLADAFSPAPLRLSLRKPCGWELPPPLARKLRNSGDVTSYICESAQGLFLHDHGLRREASAANGFSKACTQTGSHTMGAPDVAAEG